MHVRDRCSWERFFKSFYGFPKKKKKKERKEISENPDVATAVVLAQSVERVDCRAGGRGFDSRGPTSILTPFALQVLDLHVARMTT